MSNKYIINNKQGMSLIETLVAISIFVMVAIIGSEFVIKGFKSTTFNAEQETAVGSARKALEIISKEVREARASNKGDYTIGAIGTSTFTFYGDTDNDNSVEKIQYFINGNKLQKRTTESGVANDYTSTTTVSDVALYVNNQTETIFRYYDANNNETGIINRVRLINVNLKINVNPLVAPQDYYVETDIQLRNLKDNL